MLSTEISVSDIEALEPPTTGFVLLSTARQFRDIVACHLKPCVRRYLPTSLARGVEERITH